MSSQYTANLEALLGKTQETLKEFRAFSVNEQHEHKKLLLKHAEVLKQNSAMKQQLADFYEADLTREAENCAETVWQHCNIPDKFTRSEYIDTNNIDGVLVFYDSNSIEVGRCIMTVLSDSRKKHMAEIGKRVCDRLLLYQNNVTKNTLTILQENNLEQEAYNCTEILRGKDIIPVIFQHMLDTLTKVISTVYLFFRQ